MKKIVLATAIALLMVGCGKSAPGCSDSDSKELVIQIVSEKRIVRLQSTIETINREIKKNKDTKDKQIYNLEKELEAYKNLTIVNIRTESKDDELEKISDITFSSL